VGQALTTATTGRPWPRPQSQPRSRLRVLVTGAAGRVGRIVVPQLRVAWDLRLLDLVQPADFPDGLERPSGGVGSAGGRGEVGQPAGFAGGLERSVDGLGPAEPAEPAGAWVIGSVTDLDAMIEACRGVDAVIHLAGIAGEDTWDRIMAVNVDGTRTVLEAARVAGVPRVVLASSVHAVGFWPAGEVVPAECPPCPDTFYGVSKAAVEALGSLYHSRFGLDVICVRIGSCFVQPGDQHALGVWLSPGDAGRMFDACLTAEAPGFRIIWGVSANSRGRCSLREGRRLGYQPVDDSEVFAAEMPTDNTVSAHLGGTMYTTTELGRPIGR
jgi:uronate dehydrogenase